MSSQDNILKVNVSLSNFEGRDSVSVEEFLGYASMSIAEDNYRAGRREKAGNDRNSKHKGNRSNG